MVVLCYTVVACVVVLCYSCLDDCVVLWLLGWLCYVMVALLVELRNGRLIG